MARSRSPSRPAVVSITTGMEHRNGSDFRMVQQATPSMTGMFMSMKMRSGGSFLTSSSASTPFAAVTISTRENFRKLFSSSSTSLVSSTSSIFALATIPTS